VEKVVSTASGEPPGYFLEKAREMQSSHRAVVAGPADRSLTRSDAHSPLTVREIEGIRFLAKGFLYKEIADKMGISFPTVHKAQHKILAKLHTSNRTEAINNVTLIPVIRG